MKITNIFITNVHGHDTSPADEFLKDGKIIPITEGRQNIFNTESQIRHIKQVLKNMNSNDYLLLAGNATVSSICTALVFEKFGIVNLLIWDARKSGYVERTLK